jgi:hypothetical protein
MTAVLERPTAGTVIVPAGDEAVLAIAVRLHDQKCRAAGACYNRRFHALDSFGIQVRNFLAVMGEAAAAGELR